jgi:hypothetical protein
MQPYGFGEHIGVGACFSVRTDILLSSYEAVMQHTSEAVTLRFRARLCPKSPNTQTKPLRLYSWVKERGGEMCLVAKQEVISESSVSEEHSREFRIEVHTSDDTIAIYEAKTGGGFGGCVFARARVPSSQYNQHIKPCDVYSGGTLSVAGRVFRVLEADAFTMRHVRANPLLFPLRALPAVLRAIVDAQLLEPLAYAFCQRDLPARGVIETSEFLHVLSASASSATALQDHIALAQEYVVETAGTSSQLKISYTSFLSALQVVARGELSRPGPPPHSSPSHPASPAADPIDLQTQLRHRLLARGLNSGHKFLSELVEAGRTACGLLDASTLQRALAAAGIRDAPLSQLQDVASSFSDSQPFVHDVLRSVQRCFNAGQRAEVCRRMFRALDKQATGTIAMLDLIGRFNSGAAFQCLRGNSSSAELRAQWIATFDGQCSAPGILEKKNFLDAMSELSWTFVDDSLFNTFVERSLGARTSLTPIPP